MNEWQPEASAERAHHLPLEDFASDRRYMGPRHCISWNTVWVSMTVNSTRSRTTRALLKFNSHKEGESSIHVRNKNPAAEGGP